MTDNQIEEARIRAVSDYIDKDDAVNAAKEEEAELFRYYIEAYLHQLADAKAKFGDREILTREELVGIIFEDLEAML